MLEDFYKEVQHNYSTESGAIFYSGRSAFSGKKSLYILGLNPGGSPQGEAPTIKEHSEEIISKKDTFYSEYKQGEWYKGAPGEYPLQKRVLHLLKNLNLKPEETPASNVCFQRSPTEAKADWKMADTMKRDWPFHKLVIDSLKIKVILCFGHTAGNFVYKQLKGKNKKESFIEKNGRRWKTTSYELENNRVLIIAAHPSRSDWTNPDCDISEFVKRYV